MINIKKIITLSLCLQCLFIFKEASAVDNNTQCIVGGMTLGFFNGVNNSYMEARNSLYAIKNSGIKLKHNDEDIDLKLFYNFSGGLLQDITEVFKQRSQEDKTNYINSLGDLILKNLAQPPLSRDLAKHRGFITQIIEENQNEKLIFVAHSQGNLFMNKAYDYALSLYALSLSKAENIKAVHIAPASQVLNGEYILANIDLVISYLRLTGSGEVKSPNVTLSSSHLLADPSGHTLNGTYLFKGEPAANRVKLAIDRAIVDLALAEQNETDACIYELTKVETNNNADFCSDDLYDVKYEVNPPSIPSNGFISFEIPVLSSLLGEETEEISTLSLNIGANSTSGITIKISSSSLNPPSGNVTNVADTNQQEVLFANTNSIQLNKDVSAPSRFVTITNTSTNPISISPELTIGLESISFVGKDSNPMEGPLVSSGRYKPDEESGWEPFSCNMTYSHNYLSPKITLSRNSELIEFKSGYTSSFKTNSGEIGCFNLVNPSNDLSFNLSKDSCDTLSYEFASDFNRYNLSFGIDNGSISGNIIYDYFFDRPPESDYENMQRGTYTTPLIMTLEQ